MSGLEASVEKMRRDDVGDAAVEAFADAYERLSEGETGVLPEAEIEPVDDLPAAATSTTGPEADARARPGRRASSSTAASARAWA